LCFELPVLSFAGNEDLHQDMPTALNSPTIQTLTEFTALIERLLGSAKGPLWHRGCADFDNHHLSPGLYRHPTIKDADRLLALEERMLTHFRQRSDPFISRPLKDNDWERLFFMQHFEIPTRLLDWSENPFVALFFALTSEPDHPDADAAVWMLDPVSWNRKSLDNMTFTEGILTVEDGLLDGFKPGADQDTMNTDPVAIYGFHNSARIVAQRGVFTISGKDTGRMEEIYKNRDYPQDCLLKVRLPKAVKVNLLDSLFKVGFTHSVVYPDLAGLAKEMKHFFKF
jgi:hypothetical protein